MDMVDILGGLLGHQTSRGGKGSDALNDIFRRGSRDSSGGSKPTDIGREAKDLEDLLNVANDRQSGSPQGRSTPQSTSPSTAPRSSPTGPPSHGGEQQASILIRAMINAAKADGRLDQNEQESILKQMRNPRSNPPPAGRTWGRGKQPRWSSTAASSACFRPMIGFSFSYLYNAARQPGSI